ncbi:putative leucine-rich repeat-containing protein DDB_G0290503 [Lates calcarifer]|uniref:Leucine-rich repeat-containing protein DDB_G0290503 n=1 Tax=Lates calcarifer TaxID=8187 RepID=A0A4W6BRH9_LATCA|nr:putative leucine-rich repeat-containing protein DDB_G0290503 [Lates calcarifer]XP_050932042.1 putative leucine-rich repeat-containing protein DDB_G0290503 [Lates calcarifer]XP_050932043.1 putative leucine-rich repeat-containing protein DDB_G0290503 [Lates calcarifer]
MSSRGKNDLCRICGGDLQGNQRRWLFACQKKKTGQLQTPTESLRGESLSQSSQSSPWGSTLSLGSLASLSKSQLSLSSQSKAMDLLSVLTHILGQSVPRGCGQGEFVCGKCVCALERVFKFDSVIARVRVLSSERLQKLTQERDKIRQWVRHNYHQRHPRDFKSRGSTSEEDGEAEKEGYREMLKENMALSEYECWSEKWDTCPYFIRTGKRCRKGKGCEGCDSLRVSDSDYESVCGVPRHLPFQPFSPLPLSRDKSQSMPLNWQRVPSSCSSPASLVGSSLSLHASSRTESIQSLDSLDGNDPFDSPGHQSVNFMLKELRGIEGKPVSSPSGSRIPVLDRKDGRSSEKTGDMASPRVNRVLNFGDVENGGDEMDEENGDVLTELRDEFMPLQRESATGRVHHAVRHLRGQLDQAVSRIRTLEAELKHGRSKPAEVNGSDWAPLDQEEEGGDSLLQSLRHSLHSRERLIQECMGLIRRLCVEEGAGTELANKLTEKLTENLKEILSDNKAALKTLKSEMTEKEKGMENEIEALRKAGRDRERDLDTLNSVLQCNQDIINDLRVALGEKEGLLKEVEKEKEVWRQRDRALAAVLQEKDSLIHCLKEELEKRQQALSDSVTGQEMAGGGAGQAAWLEDREGNSATLCQEVTKLTTALQEYQDMVQDQQESHNQTVCSLTSQLKDIQQKLREKEKEKKEADRAWQNIREDREREERKLRHSLEKRDKLIEQILLDAEERDLLFRELQQNLQNKREPVTAIKHTL